MRRAWIAVLVAASVFVLLDLSVNRRRGLTRSAVDDDNPVREYASTAVTSIDLVGVSPAIIDRSGVSLVWRGFWEIPAADLYDVRVESHGAATLDIDGQRAFESGSAQDAPSRTIWLTPGFHQLEIRYRPDPAGPRIDVSAARSGRTLAPFSADDLKPSLPRNPRVREWSARARTVVGWLFVAVLVVALRKTLPRMDLSRSRLVFDRARRPAAWLGLVLILTYGALLRVDAIAIRYGPVTSPGWLAAIQTRTVLAPQTIRPAWFPWVPAPLSAHQDGPPTKYISDPYSYLEVARSMTSFWEPTWREPLFPFGVKSMMALIGDQDVAVSFTSTAFSLLAILFTYLLGASLWSRPVGLVAAFALAADRDTAWFASQGWRDDAYVAAMTLGAVLILRCWQSARRPQRTLKLGRFAIDALVADAVLLGIGGGVIILTRIMSLAFLLPAGVVLVLSMRTAWKQRLIVASVTIATAFVVSAPYFINCWRTTGDPFLTFNVHGDIYRVAEGQAAVDKGTLFYISEKLGGRPYKIIDTLSRGVTVYPFVNKWEGLDGWRQGLGAVVAIASVVGMAVLAFLPAGRLALLVFWTSLLPFSLTWTVDPNPRFTLHAYPILLVSAAVASSCLLRIVRRLVLPGPASATAPWSRDTGTSSVRDVLTGGAVVATAALAIWFVVFVSPRLVFADALAVRGDGTISAGSDDGALGEGWSRAMGAGNFRVRMSVGESQLQLPLPEQDDYRLTIRLDPFPRPFTANPAQLPIVEYGLNGTTLGTIALKWSPERIGAYEITLPRAAVRAGTNTLTLRMVGESAMPGLAEGQAFIFWLLRASRPPT